MAEEYIEKKSRDRQHHILTYSNSCISVSQLFASVPIDQGNQGHGWLVKKPSLLFVSIVPRDQSIRIRNLCQNSSRNLVLWPVMDLGFCAIFSSFITFFLSIAEFGYIPSPTNILQFSPFSSNLIWRKGVSKRTYNNYSWDFPLIWVIAFLNFLTRPTCKGNFWKTHKSK